MFECPTQSLAQTAAKLGTFNNYRLDRAFIAVALQSSACRIQFPIAPEGELNEVESDESIVEVIDAARQVNAGNLAPIDPEDEMRPGDPYASGGQVNSAMMRVAHSKVTDEKPVKGLKTAERLKLVNQGVQLVLIGILISLLSMVLLAVPWSLALFMILGLIQLAGGMFQIAGLILCLFAPRSSHSRPFAITALSCTASGSLFLKLFEVIASNTSGEGEPTILTMLAWVAHMAGTAFFLFALRKLALYTGQRPEADEAKFLAIFMCVLAGTGLFLGMFIPALGMGTLVIFAVLFIAHLIWLFQFMSFLDKLKFRKSFTRKRKSIEAWDQARSDS